MHLKINQNICLATSWIKWGVGMPFVFSLRRSFRLLDIGDRIIAYTLAKLPYHLIILSWQHLLLLCYYSPFVWYMYFNNNLHSNRLRYPGGSYYVTYIHYLVPLVEPFKWFFRTNAYAAIRLRFRKKVLISPSFCRPFAMANRRWKRRQRSN